MEKIYNKLVRDKIPENIDNMKGRKSKYKILDDAEYLKELNRKVLEEANEFIEENSIEELGDLMEVLNAIMKLKGYKLEEVNKIMKEKNEKKGMAGKSLRFMVVGIPNTGKSSFINRMAGKNKAVVED